LDALAVAGFFTRDRVLGESEALALRRSAESLHAADAFRAAGIGRGSERRAELATRSDATAWLWPDSPGFAPLFGLFEALRVGLNRAVYLGLERYEVQLARYAEGARYQRHQDAFAGPASRRVTAIYYLNPDWIPAHGGELRLYVSPPVELAPVADRLVVFLSDRVEHEVLPTRATRFAATAWYYGR
jgi:SM-20-related protein